MRLHLLGTLAIAALMIVPGLGHAQTTDTSSTGRRVDFPLTQFQDTLFTGIDGVFRVREDAGGHIWYTTEGALVHVDPYNKTRELFTKLEGLPSSYTLGLDVKGDQVYVGTDLGLGVVDRPTGRVAAITPSNSPLPDHIVYEPTLVGDDLWIGTRFFGIAIWNTTKPSGDEAAWTFKNTSTTAGYAQAVRRIVPTATAVWVATEGDGAWRYDRVTGTWNVTVVEDGLPDSTVLSVAERAGTTYFGTTKGIGARDAAGAWTYYNKTRSGLSDDRVLDLDVIATTSGVSELFAATRKGVWQMNPDTGRNVTLAQSFGILGSYVFDNTPAKRGWLFATDRGVSHFFDGDWHYYATGPSSGPSNGPLAYGYTSASVGDGKGYLWFGSPRGLSAYRVPTDGSPGYWQNFGAWQNYPGSVVNWIDTEGNTTWFGTNSGTYGFEHESGRWIPKLAQNSRNLVYSVDAIGDELWIALFGDGLMMENRTTGLIRSWDFKTLANPAPDQYFTDVRVSGDTVWLGASIGVVKMDRVSGNFRATYGKPDGVPGSGVVFRVLPEGPVVWVGTKDGGVAKLDVATGKVGRVWNATNSPGFPGGETRSLYREGGRLWVGTENGLARIDITTGEFRAWNQTSSGLVQNFVNGITSSGGFLYIATLSGVQRMDIAKGEFLPLWDGRGVIRGEGSSGAVPGVGRVNVRIDAPRDGTGVTGDVQVRGSALVFGAKVDKVEVRIGQGAWMLANGTEAWSLDWNTADLAPNTPVRVSARAFAGNLTGEAEILVTPVAAPTIPLSLEEVAPEAAFANRPLRLAARVEGDEPLSANLFYKPAGTSNFVRVTMARQGNLFLATIPARDMREGDMRYFMEAQSGLLTANAAGDAYDPSTLQVAPAPRLAVAVEGPAHVVATAGVEERFALNVTNAGTQPASFRLAASGLRAAWIGLPLEDIALAPGETRAVQVTLNVPAAAFSDNTTLTFEARDAQGSADPATASVPVEIKGTDGSKATVTTPSSPSKGRVIPGPAAAWVAVAIVALALALRRRTP